jgi:methyl-accepting chemotaxis protein
VHNRADNVITTATQLAASSAQITRGSQAQSEAAASTAAAVEEITVSISAVASNTEEVRKLSEQSLVQTRNGNQNVTAMIGEIHSVQEAVNLIAGSVKEFVDSTRAIAGMTQQVKDIADQTNLLALNAAIEAARAGEQGRGFAVVADEVRKLAEKSAQSASEIDKVTNSLNQKSSHVEATVQDGLRSLQATQEHIERVSTVLTEAGDSVTKSSHGVSDIAASVNEQSLASSEIARNVEKIAQMSEENHAAVDSNSRDIVRLESLAKELQTAVGRFKA